MINEMILLKYHGYALNTGKRGTKKISECQKESYNIAKRYGKVKHKDHAFRMKTNSES